MKRRYFIGLASMVTASMVVGIRGWPYLQGRAVEFVKTVIRYGLDYLDIDEAGLDQFAQKFIEAKGNSLTFKTGAAGISLNWVNEVDALRSIIGADRFEELESEFVLKFLLSSDFFQNESDESTLVSFVSYYDPLLPTCNHPFAKFDGL